MPEPNNPTASVPAPSASVYLGRNFFQSSSPVPSSKTAADPDVARASSRAGCEDPSYFSRMYKKLFGFPSQRDIARLRGSLEH